MSRSYTAEEREAAIAACRAAGLNPFSHADYADLRNGHERWKDFLGAAGLEPPPTNVQEVRLILKVMDLAEVRHRILEVHRETHAVSLALVAVLPAIGFMVAQQLLGLVPHWLVLLIVLAGSLPGIALFLWFQRRLQRAFRCQREEVLKDV